MHKGCVGFDFNTATKDCWLSGTPWSKVSPIAGPGGRPIANRMTCTRGQADQPESESLLVANVASDDAFPMDDEMVMKDDEDEITPEEGVLVEEDEIPDTAESDEVDTESDDEAESEEENEEGEDETEVDQSEEDESVEEESFDEEE